MRQIPVLLCRGMWYHATNPLRKINVLSSAATARRYCRTQQTQNCGHDEGVGKRDPANSPNLLVVRCDVERNIEHARDFAHDLQRIGIPATMFFHTRQECYDPEVFAEIAGLGHEIGSIMNASTVVGAILLPLGHFFCGKLNGFAGMALRLRPSACMARTGLRATGTARTLIYLRVFRRFWKKPEWLNHI